MEKMKCRAAAKRFSIAVLQRKCYICNVSISGLKLVVNSAGKRNTERSGHPVLGSAPFRNNIFKNEDPYVRIGHTRPIESTSTRII